MSIILIVYDSPIVRRTLGFTLKKSGYTVLEAAHGADALDKLAKTAVDLVISDMTMPEVDGLTLLQRLRADKRYKNLPVVMHTASGQNQDRLRAEQEGADGFLTKPASSRELIAIASQFVNSSS